MYDPMVPRDYYIAWKVSTGDQGGQPTISHYCPGIANAGIARPTASATSSNPMERVGPSAACTTPKSTGRISTGSPGRHPLSWCHSRRPDNSPRNSAIGVPVPVSHPNPAAWRLTTNSSTPQVLRLHLTNVPGWHATIDGRPLTLKQYSLIMLQAEIPPGRHVIELKYWRVTFTEGIVLAVLAAVGLIVAPFAAYALFDDGGTGAGNGLGPWAPDTSARTTSG